MNPATCGKFPELISPRRNVRAIRESGAKIVPRREEKARGIGSAFKHAGQNTTAPFPGTHDSPSHKRLTMEGFIL
jgi:hypothetical protein